MAEHQIDEKTVNDASGESITEQSVPAAEYHKLEAEKNALFDRLARLQAEFENFRKRSAREQADYREYATAEAARAFIPTLDSFDLALRSAPQGDAALRSGMELMRKQLEDAFGRLGVQAIPARGEAFDPRFHEAIETVETSEYPDHQVIDELQRGYKIKERLLRPAMVRVAQSPKK
jgi:molecular chaperone GrpE